MSCTKTVPVVDKELVYVFPDDSMLQEEPVPDFNATTNGELMEDDKAVRGSLDNTNGRIRAIRKWKQLNQEGSK